MQLLSHDKGRDLAGGWGRDLGDPIAVVRLEPGDLAKDRGLAFISGYDDLDSLLFALFRARSRKEYALVRTYWMTGNTLHVDGGENVVG